MGNVEWVGRLRIEFIEDGPELGDEGGEVVDCRGVQDREVD